MFLVSFLDQEPSNEEGEIEMTIEGWNSAGSRPAENYVEIYRFCGKKIDDRREKLKRKLGRRRKESNRYVS